MVGWMSYGNKKYAVLEPTVRQAILPLHGAVQELLPLIDADATAFTAYMVSVGVNFAGRCAFSCCTGWLGCKEVAWINSGRKGKVKVCSY